MDNVNHVNTDVVKEVFFASFQLRKKRRIQSLKTSKDFLKIPTLQMMP